jgi:hypothetical protein
VKNRSVMEIIVLTFTLIIAFVIVGLSSALIFLEVRDPSTDTSVLTATLSSLVSAIFGVLVGTMINKGDKINSRPDDEEEGE